MKIIILIFLLFLSIKSVSVSKMNFESLIKKSHPFAYALDLKLIPSKQANAPVTICCHGYGHSNKIAEVVHSFRVIPDHLLGFNFPDYGIIPSFDHNKTTFGSIDEILPLLFVLKLCVIDAGQDIINLYGFSAGGGAIINALALLNRSQYAEKLTKIGITDNYKKKIIAAVEKGLIILDCPLKSMEEIIDLRGKDLMLEIMSECYKKNDMRPIDAIDGLLGLKLNIILHFQDPDDILSNRDDTLFSNKLTTVNKGNTCVVIGKDGGHNTFHASLWKEYKKWCEL